MPREHEQPSESTTQKTSSEREAVLQYTGKGWRRVDPDEANANLTHLQEELARRQEELVRSAE